METNKNITNVTANAVNTTNTNAIMSADMQYVYAHKSELAGNLDDVIAALNKAYMREERERKYVNGRLATLSKAVTNPTLRRGLNSVEFKTGVRSGLTHVTVHIYEGDVLVRTMHIPCKMRRITEETKAESIVVLDNEVIKKWTNVKLTKGQKMCIDGLLFAADESEIAFDPQQYVQHEYERTVMQEAIAADGTKCQVPVMVADEEGNLKAKKEVTVGNFYPVLDESVTPKAFINAVDNALKSMWLRLFPAKQEESANAEATAA